MMMMIQPATSATSPRVDDLLGALHCRGFVSLPGTQRQVWWTGRVAIGLRFQPTRADRTLNGAETWVQEQLLRPR